MNRQRGQTLLEIVIALGVFSLLSAALISLILGSLYGAQQGSQHLEADAFAQEGIEAIRSIRDGAWNELPSGQSGLAISGGQWIASGSSNSIPPFTRTITARETCRTAQGDIAQCPASYTDPHTKYIESSVSWNTIEQAQNSVQRNAYLTNWDSALWFQTDWILGPGQQTWSLPAMYGSDDGHINRLAAGQIQIAQNIGSGSWSIHTTLPSERTLRGVSALSADDAWAVGDNGTIVHYNGTAWVTVSSPVTSRLNSIHMLSSTLGWAVGVGGKIIRYNGTQWVTESFSEDNELNSIFMVSPIDGWAVGAAGKILHYNGTNWVEFADTGGMEWYDVGFISPTDGWLVGNQGLIYHWNGISWSLNADTGGTVWSSVHMFSALDGWLTGDQGVIYHWNGISWSLHSDMGGDNWNAVHGTLPTDGWIVGAGGQILHWNGIIWQVVSSPTNSVLRGVAMVSGTLGWAVGDGGKILRYVAQAYYASGTLLSSAFPLVDASPVTVIEWDESLPTCTPVCDVRFQVRTAPDNGGAPGIFGPWYGATGIDTYFTNPRGAIIPKEVNGNRWVQYRVILDGDMQNTPTLSEVRMYYQ